MTFDFIAMTPYRWIGGSIENYIDPVSHSLSELAPCYLHSPTWLQVQIEVCPNSLTDDPCNIYIGVDPRNLFNNFYCGTMITSEHYIASKLFNVENFFGGLPTKHGLFLNVCYGGCNSKLLKVITDVQ